MFHLEAHFWYKYLSHFSISFMNNTKISVNNFMYDNDGKIFDPNVVSLFHTKTVRIVMNSNTIMPKMS